VRSFLCPRARGYWVHRWAPRRACFHACTSAMLEDRYLRSCGTILRPFSHLTDSPSEFLQLDRCPRLSARATTYQGLCPLRDITPVRLPVTGVPKSPIRSVLRRSQPPDGLFRSEAHKLVSSCNRVQGAPRSGVWPLCTATLPRREELPPCRWCEARSPTNRLPQTTHLDFEAFLHTESRITSSAVRPRPRTLPSSGLLLLQVLSGPPRLVPQTRTLMALSARALDCASAVPDLHVPPPACWRAGIRRSRLRERQPARAFRAFPDSARRATASPHARTAAPGLRRAHGHIPHVSTTPRPSRARRASDSVEPASPRPKSLGTRDPERPRYLGSETSTLDASSSLESLLAGTQVP
jgi:hypothetical protein